MATFRIRQDIAADIVSAIDADFAQERADRTTDDRPHVSELIHCLTQGWRLRQGQGEKGRPDPDNMTLLRGQAWDAIADRASKQLDNYESKIRVETDYMVGEADTLSLELFNGQPCIIDNKTTAAGPNGSKTAPGPAPLRWPHYVEQVAAYCVGLNEAGHNILQGALAVLHLPMPTTFKVWQIIFSKDELARWGQELRRRSALLMGDIEPSTSEHADYECQYCPFAIKVGGDCAGYGYGRPAGFFMLDPDDGDI